MLSEKSANSLKKLGWTKKREIDLERTYPLFFREQAYINKKKFAAIRPKLANYCGLSIESEARQISDCIFKLYPYSILGLNGIRQMGEFLGFDVILIGELDECVPMLMAFDGRTFVYNDSSVDKYRDMYEFENIEALINFAISNNLQEAKILDASGFKWKGATIPAVDWGSY